MQIKTIRSRFTTTFNDQVNSLLQQNYKIISSGAIAVDFAGHLDLEWWAILEYNEKLVRNYKKD